MYRRHFRPRLFTKYGKIMAMVMMHMGTTFTRVATDMITRAIHTTIRRMDMMDMGTMDMVTTDTLVSVAMGMIMITMAKAMVMRTMGMVTRNMDTMTGTPIRSMVTMMGMVIKSTGAMNMATTDTLVIAAVATIMMTMAKATVMRTMGMITRSMATMRDMVIRNTGPRMDTVMGTQVTQVNAARSNVRGRKTNAPLHK